MAGEPTYAVRKAYNVLGEKYCGKKNRFGGVTRQKISKRRFEHSVLTRPDKRTCILHFIRYSVVLQIEGQCQCCVRQVCGHSNIYSLGVSVSYFGDL